MSSLTERYTATSEAQSSHGMLALVSRAVHATPRSADCSGRRLTASLQPSHLTGRAPSTDYRPAWNVSSLTSRSTTTATISHCPSDFSWSSGASDTASSPHESNHRDGPSDSVATAAVRPCTSTQPNKPRSFMAPSARSAYEPSWINSRRTTRPRLSTFRFSDTSDSGKEDEPADFTFHRLIRQAAACTRVSPNFTQLPSLTSQEPLAAEAGQDVTPASLKNRVSESTKANAEPDVTRRGDRGYRSPLFASERTTPSLSPIRCCGYTPSSPVRTSEPGLFTVDAFLFPVDSPSEKDIAALTPSSRLESSAEPGDSYMILPASGSEYLDPTANEHGSSPEPSANLAPYETFSDLDCPGLHDSPTHQCEAASQSPLLADDDRAALDDVALTHSLPRLSQSSVSGTCAICLTDVADVEFIGRLAMCNHMFCFECIMKWSEVTNHCPLCKQQFRTVSKWRLSLPSKRIVHVCSTEVEDKTLRLNDDEEGVLARAHAALDDYICQVCRDGNQEEVLLLCDGCDDAYHTFCVGLSDIPAGSWFCDACGPARESASNETETNVVPRNLGRRMMNDVVRFWNRAFETHLQSQRNSNLRQSLPRVDVSSLSQQSESSQRHYTTRRRQLSPDVSLDHTSRRPITRSIAARERRRRQALSCRTSSNIDTIDDTLPARRRLCRPQAVEEPVMGDPVRPPSSLEQRIRDRWSRRASTVTETQHASSSAPRDTFTLSKDTCVSTLSSSFDSQIPSPTDDSDGSLWHANTTVTPSCTNSSSSSGSSDSAASSSSSSNSLRRAKTQSNYGRYANSESSESLETSLDLCDRDAQSAFTHRRRRLRKARTIDEDSEDDNTLLWDRFHASQQYSAVQRPLRISICGPSTTSDPSESVSPAVFRGRRRRIRSCLPSLDSAPESTPAVSTKKRKCNATAF